MTVPCRLGHVFSLRCYLFHAIVMGAPASGKGTISSRIVSCFNLNHISTGDLLRLHMENRTGKHIQNNRAMAGVLFSDLQGLILKNDDWSLKARLQPTYPLVGLATTQSQMHSTKFQGEQLLKKEHINVVINLVVPYDVILERVQGRWIHLQSGRVYNSTFNAPKVQGVDDITGEQLIQRPDDQPEAVKKRLENYSQTAQPLFDLFREAGILKDFHGTETDEIWPKVYEYLGSYLRPLVEQSQ
uniref:Adenylate kinase active site lid domain-containing protein n=1 Tax=Timema cristinae TaxID=61476 RepID=A0A7R9H0Q2_TIMCR|nr:unnamed protein product [Timema cristinae]